MPYEDDDFPEPDLDPRFWRIVGGVICIGLAISSLTWFIAKH